MQVVHAEFHLDSGTLATTTPNTIGIIIIITLS